MLQHAPTPPLAYRINNAEHLLGLSRSTLYRLISAGELDLIKLSPRASAVTRESITRYAAARSIPLPAGF